MIELAKSSILLLIVLIGMFFWARKIRKWLFIGLVGVIAFIMYSQTHS